MPPVLLITVVPPRDALRAAAAASSTHSSEVDSARTSRDVVRRIWCLVFSLRPRVMRLPGKLLGNLGASDSKCTSDWILRLNVQSYVTTVIRSSRGAP